MWFKHAQKGQKPTTARPERAEALSPGQRPGFVGVSLAPCKGKSFKTHTEIYKAFALTGRIADCYYTQGAALG